MSTTNIVTLSSATGTGAEVSNAHFGANATFDFQTLGNYTTASAHFDFGSVRYPGGTETEAYFDISNPNITDPVDENGNPILNNQGNPVTLIPRDAFLAKCVADNTPPVIVVPMTDLSTDDGTGALTFDETQQAALRQFVRETLDLMGGVGVAAFELGNEYAKWMTASESTATSPVARP